MKRLLVLALALVVGACASTTTSSPGASEPRGGASRGRRDDSATATSEPAVPLVRDTRALDANERAMLDELVGLTAEVRGLAPTREVAARVASSQVIAAHLVAGIEEEELVELVDLYQALGMLDPGTDIVSMLARVVGEQVVGFYDPKLDLLVLRDDVMATFARTGHLESEALVTIAHEVVHALQGQRLSLRERMEEELDTDVSDAYQALVEGDATLGMVLVAARVRRLPVDDVLGSLPTNLDFSAGSGAPGTVELASAPPIVRIGLTAPYVAGLGFCAKLFEHGGSAAVDGAHARRPVSTEQIMHPEKYLAGEAPDAIDLGELPEVEGAGFRQVGEDTLGELELGIYLGRGTTNGYDPDAGSGWGGDRVRVYRAGRTSLAAVLVASFDTEADAIEAERAAARDSVASSRARYGRVFVATHGLSPEAYESVHARAREIAASLETRIR